MIYHKSRKLHHHCGNITQEALTIRVVQMLEILFSATEATEAKAMLAPCEYQQRKLA